MHLYPINGAAARVAKDDTAYSFREAKFAEVIVGVDPEPANNRPHAVGRGLLGRVHPYSAGGGYINFMMDEGEEHVQAAVPRQLRAARQVKKKYDPRTCSG